MQVSRKNLGITRDRTKQITRERTRKKTRQRTGEQIQIKVEPELG